MFASLEPRRLYSTVMSDGGPLGTGNRVEQPGQLGRRSASNGQ